MHKPFLLSNVIHGCWDAAKSIFVILWESSSLQWQRIEMSASSLPLCQAGTAPYPCGPINRAAWANFFPQTVYNLS